MLKSKKGITLVALIVTIIILLILAGVTIAQLTENGLFEKARKAGKESENAQAEENGILEAYQNQIDDVLYGEKCYYVILKANNGTNEEKNLKVDMNTIVQLPENTYILENCDFVGWATSEDGDIVYTDKQEISNLTECGENIVLYARFSHTHKTSCYEAGTEYTALTNYSDKKHHTIGAKEYYTYADESCTQSLGKISMHIKEGTPKYPIKIINSTGNTCYLNGSYDIYTSITGTFMRYSCSKCGLYYGYASDDISILHKCAKESMVCELETGLQ